MSLCRSRSSASLLLLLLLLLLSANKRHALAWFEVREQGGTLPYSMVTTARAPLGSQ